MLESPSILLTVFAFLLMIGPLIVIHELGHYWAGRLCGVRALTFSVGFGKELWHRIDKRGTRWRIAAFPLGGYVQFAGDADPSSRPDPSLEGASQETLKGTLPGATLLQRSFISFAGPLANLVTAVLIFAGFAAVYGTLYAAPVVGRFSEKSAAQAAGIQLGDRIVAIDGARIDEFSDIAPRVALYPDQTVRLEVERAGRQLEIPVKVALVTEKDRFGNEYQRGLLGVGGTKVEVRKLGPLAALGFGIGASYEQIRTTAIALKQMVVGQRSVADLSGLPRTAKVSGEMMALGWFAFVQFVAFVSINLAFINLLPIPTLDGGHLAMYAAEAVRRKPLDIRSQELAFRIGMGFVLALAVFVNMNDLIQMFL
ncbi:MAG: M50 family metallopeptidase [Novosphingobium sp.]|uniref:M50 family metallopeptidase n=1 Tax=Novosphingobium sp. TaxID=1874826 RepID=UPI0032BE48C0